MLVAFNLCRVAFAADVELEREERSHRHRLFWLNADRWNDFGPIVDVAGDEGGEFRRRTAHCVQALKLHLEIGRAHV